MGRGRPPDISISTQVRWNDHKYYQGTEDAAEYMVDAVWTDHTLSLNDALATLAELSRHGEIDGSLALQIMYEGI